MIRLFRVSIPTTILVLVLGELILVIGCYVGATYLVWGDPTATLYLFDEGGIWRIALATAVVVLGLYFHDLYDDFRVQSRIQLVQQLCVVVGISFLIQAMASYGRSSVVLSKWTMLLGSILILVLLPAWRFLYSSMASKAFRPSRLLFLGTSLSTREIVAKLNERPDLGLIATGYLDDNIHERLEASMPRLGGMQDLGTVVTAYKPNRIIVGMPDRRDYLPVDQLLRLRLSGIHIEQAAATYEMVFGRISTRDLRPSHLVFSEEFGPHSHNIAFQLVYSWLLALILFILASPIVLIVALLVRFSSPGPILLRQVRTGLNGKPFSVLKFRSMYQDAEARTGAVWATKNDPRITPVGRWLRRYRLDELPQLFNVLRGDMSLVGPRPERPEFVKVLQENLPFYSHRHCVKPGITGWAQINHAYTDSIDDTVIKLEYDLYYIKNMNWMFDFYILFHTAKTMLLGRGAR